LKTENKTNMEDVNIIEEEEIFNPHKVKFYKWLIRDVKSKSSLALFLLISFLLSITALSFNFSSVISNIFAIAMSLTPIVILIAGQYIDLIDAKNTYDVEQRAHSGR